MDGDKGLKLVSELPGGNTELFWQRRRKNRREPWTTLVGIVYKKLPDRFDRQNPAFKK